MCFLTGSWQPFSKACVDCMQVWFRQPGLYLLCHSMQENALKRVFCIEWG